MEKETFDLEKALRGKPVVTRNGQEVSQLHLFKGIASWEGQVLAGVVNQKFMTFTTKGTFHVDGTPHELDLFMVKEEMYVLVTEQCIKDEELDDCTIYLKYPDTDRDKFTKRPRNGKVPRKMVYKLVLVDEPEEEENTPLKACPLPMDESGGLDLEHKPN